MALSDAAVLAVVKAFTPDVDDTFFAAFIAVVYAVAAAEYA